MIFIGNYCVCLFVCVWYTVIGWLFLQSIILYLSPLSLFFFVTNYLVKPIGFCCYMLDDFVLYAFIVILCCCQLSVSEVYNDTYVSAVTFFYVFCFVCHHWRFLISLTPFCLLVSLFFWFCWWPYWIILLTLLSYLLSLCCKCESIHRKMFCLIILMFSMCCWWASLYVGYDLQSFSAVNVFPCLLTLFLYNCVVAFFYSLCDTGGWFFLKLVLSLLFLILQFLIFLFPLLLNIF